MMITHLDKSCTCMSITDMCMHECYFVIFNRHSPFRSSNAKSKEDIDHQTLNKVL